MESQHVFLLFKEGEIVCFPLERTNGKAKRKAYKTYKVHLPLGLKPSLVYNLACTMNMCFLNFACKKQKESAAYVLFEYPGSREKNCFGKCPLLQKRHQSALPEPHAAAS